MPGIAPGASEMHPMGSRSATKRSVSLAVSAPLWPRGGSRNEARSGQIKEIHLFIFKKLRFVLRRGFSLCNSSVLQVGALRALRRKLMGLGDACGSGIYYPVGSGICYSVGSGIYYSVGSGVCYSVGSGRYCSVGTAR